MTHIARDAAISSFTKEEKKGIMIVSLKCGGVGLNLIMASKVFNVDLWWSTFTPIPCFVTDDRR